MKSKKNAFEQKYYGIHACQVLFKMRPQDIIRVYVHESNVKAFSPLLKACAQNKKAYHVISSQELEKITDSVHHEGICILAKQKMPLSFDVFRKNLKQDRVGLLYLDGVQNPHNIGSILRTAAHFGIPYILGSQLPSLTPSACRIAKGGTEFVDLVQLDRPQEALKWLLGQGFAFIGTSSHEGQSIYQTKLPPKCIFAFGSESHGMSPALYKLTSHKIQIPGTGAVESLNVSVATALCLAEYTRQLALF